MGNPSEWYRIAKGISVYRRHRTWWADIRGERGGRLKKSLRTRDYKEAVALALQIARGPGLPSTVRWLDALAIYERDYSSLYHAKETRSKSHSIVGEFERFLKKTLGTQVFTVDTPSQEHVEGFMRACAVRLSPATVNSKLRTLRAFLRWSISKRYRLDDPTKGVRRLREVRRDDKELTPDELGRIIRKAEAVGDVLVLDLFRLALNTGCRPGELAHLRAGDVDLEGQIVFIRNHPTHRLKDRADRRIKLNDIALDVLRRRCLAAGVGRDILLFPSTRGTPLNLSNVAHRFKIVAVLAGVPRATLYHARHTFASLAAVYLPQFVLQEIMGHSDPGLTARHYIHAAAAKAPAPPIVGA